MKKILLSVIILKIFLGISEATAQELVQGDLSAFMDTPCYLYHEFSDDDIGGWNIITTQKGTVLANDSQGLRRSTDGGDTWSEIISIGRDVIGCNAILNEATGAVLLVNPTGYRLISHDDGLTWKREAITVLPNLIGHGSSEKKYLNAGAMQPCVTLTFGEHIGRLIMPVRWFPSNDGINWTNPLISEDGKSNLISYHGGRVKKTCHHLWVRQYA